MKLVWMCLAISGLLFSFGNCILLGQTTVTTLSESEVHKIWFGIGYYYNTATKPQHITALREKLPCTPPPDLLNALNQWAQKALPKDAVRPLLLNHARNCGGCEAIQAFKLGEWCSQLEDALLEFLLGVLTKDEETLAAALFLMPTLTIQAQGFVDTLSHILDPKVTQALQQIAGFTSVIDVVGVYFGRVKMTDLIEAVMTLPKLLDTIKQACGYS